MVYHAPFDLYYWLVTFLSGSISIFIAIAFIAMGLLAAKFRMPNQVTVICFVLFGAFFSAYLGEFWITIILLIGLIGYPIVARLIKN